MKKLDPTSLIAGAALVFLMSMTRSPKGDDVASAIILLAEATNNQAEALDKLASNTTLSGELKVVLKNAEHAGPKGRLAVPFLLKEGK